MPLKLFSAIALSCLSLALFAAQGDSTNQITTSSVESSIDIIRPADIEVEGNTLDVVNSAIASSTTAENIVLKDVISDSKIPPISPAAITDTTDLKNSPVAANIDAVALQLSTKTMQKQPNHTRHLLGVDVPPSTTTRLNWSPSRSFSGMAVDTPVLAVNGAWDGPTLCLTAAIHGDELNGIEMVRRVLYDLDPEKLHGMVVGVPIVNLLGFSRNSRYLPDRRDLNRHFPGNTEGSVASRLAYWFFNDVIKHCSAVVDLHTGSFHRTNITQLRADLSQPLVAEFVALFGDIPVLNTQGNPKSLRAAAVRAGIPTVTIEAGEPMRMQVAVVEEGVLAINTLMEKNGMYPSFRLWAEPKPAFYRSTWVRSNASGILFSRIKLGADVEQGDILGSVINPVTNDKQQIISHYSGRILGMALDQFVLPGFAVYHIGMREPNALKLLTEQSETDSDAENTPIEAVQHNLEITLEAEGFDD